MSAYRIAYGALTAILSPLLPLWLKARARNGKEDITRLNERFGRPSKPRPKGQLFWLHGASVGETTMLLPLITSLLETYPKAQILITSGTLTSARLMQERLPSRAFHQYVPLDTRKSVRSFLTHWHPDIAIWAESEIWPNLVLETQSRGIPMALINARMSAKSLSGWVKRKSFAQQIFSCFHYVQAADTLTAQGLSAFTDTPIAQFGNLKDAAPALPFDKDEFNKLRQIIDSNPVWCAASTHTGEDEVILRAHKEVRRSHPNARLILAPRHPKRRDEILTSISESAAIRSRAETLETNTSIYLFDTIGDMGLAFALSDVTLMCGSLRDGLFGHNPLEPARQNNAVLTGPHHASFKDIYEDMFAFGAAVPILDSMDLANMIKNYFTDAAALSAAQSKAYDFAQSRTAVLGDTLSALSRLISQEPVS